MYVTPLRQQRALRCEIHKRERGQEKPSDHAPVSVDLSDEVDEDEDDSIW